MASHAPAVRYANHPGTVARAWVRLPAEVQELVQLCDGTRNITALCDESGFSVTLVDRALNRLEAEGLVHRVEQVPAPATLSANARAWLRREASVARLNYRDRWSNRTGSRVVAHGGAALAR